MLEIWTFMGFLGIFEFTVENKEKCLGKAVLKMWSQISVKMVYVSTKLL